MVALESLCKLWCRLLKNFLSPICQFRRRAFWNLLYVIEKCPYTSFKFVKSFPYYGAYVETALENAKLVII